MLTASPQLKATSWHRPPAAPGSKEGPEEGAWGQPARRTDEKDPEEQRACGCSVETTGLSVFALPCPRASEATGPDDPLLAARRPRPPPGESRALLIPQKENLVREVLILNFFPSPSLQNNPSLWAAPASLGWADWRPQLCKHRVDTSASQAEPSEPPGVAAFQGKGGAAAIACAFVKLARVWGLCPGSGLGWAAFGSLPLWPHFCSAQGSGWPSLAWPWRPVCCGQPHHCVPTPGVSATGGWDDSGPPEAARSEATGQSRTELGVRCRSLAWRPSSAVPPLVQLQSHLVQTRHAAGA